MTTSTSMHFDIKLHGFWLLFRHLAPHSSSRNIETCFVLREQTTVVFQTLPFGSISTFYAVCCLPLKAVDHELKVNCVQRTASSALRVMVVAKSAISTGSLKPLVDTNCFGLQLAPASTGSRKAQLQCEMKKNSCQWVQGCDWRPLSKSCSRG